MGTYVIDIDLLLDATSDLTSEIHNHKLYLIEIDQLLERTEDW